MVYNIQPALVLKCAMSNLTVSFQLCSHIRGVYGIFQQKTYLPQGYQFMPQRIKNFSNTFCRLHLPLKTCFITNKKVILSNFYSPKFHLFSTVIKIMVYSPKGGGGVKMENIHLCCTLVSQNQTFDHWLKHAKLQTSGQKCASKVVLEIVSFQIRPLSIGLTIRSVIYVCVKTVYIKNTKYRLASFNKAFAHRRF